MPRTAEKPSFITRYPIALVALGVLVCGMGVYILMNRSEKIGELCVDQAYDDPSVTEAVDEDERVRAIETYYQNCIRNFGVGN